MYRLVVLKHARPLVAHLLLDSRYEGGPSGRVIHCACKNTDFKKTLTAVQVDVVLQREATGDSIEDFGDWLIGQSGLDLTS